MLKLIINQSLENFSPLLQMVMNQPKGPSIVSNVNLHNNSSWCTVTHYNTSHDKTHGSFVWFWQKNPQYIVILISKICFCLKFQMVLVGLINEVNPLSFCAGFSKDTIMVYPLGNDWTVSSGNQYDQLNMVNVLPI